MIKFDNYDLSTAGNFSIDTIDISTSTIGFYLFDELQDTSGDGAILEFSNIQYHDCTFEFSENLFYFTNMFSTSTFTVMIRDSHFSNIHFTSGGVLMNFAHQLDSAVTLKSTQFTSIHAGRLEIESFNKQSSAATLVNIENITAYSLNSSFVSFIQAGQGTNLKISQSEFYDIHSTFRGPVISSTFQGTLVDIQHSVFYNNSAFTAGVMLADQESKITCTNCTIYSNFGVEVGVVLTLSNAIFEISDSKIYGNLAMAKPVLEIIESVDDGLFSNVEIYDNRVVTQTEVVTEVTTDCIYLCFLDPGTYTEAKIQELAQNLREDKSIFSLSFGNLQISSNTRIYNTDIILNSFVSTVSITSCSISNTSSSEVPFSIASTTLSLSSSTFTNITKAKNIALISTNVESEVTVTDTEFSSSQGPFIQLTGSSMTVNNLSITGIESSNQILILYTTTDASLSRISFNSISGSLSDLIFIEDSTLTSISNVQISDLNYGAISMKRVKISSIISVNFSNLTHGIKMVDSNVTEVRDSTFEKLGSRTFLKGGAVWLTRSNVVFINNTFQHNMAVSGAAVYVQCKGTTTVDL